MRKGLRKGNEGNEGNRGKGSNINDSMVEVEDRFDRMVNSEDGSRKTIVIKYLLVCTVVLAVVVFFLNHSFVLVDSFQNNIYNYRLIGRRSALVRHARMLLTQYIRSPGSQPEGLPSIKALTQQVIEEFYML